MSESFPSFMSVFGNQEACGYSNASSLEKDVRSRDEPDILGQDLTHSKTPSITNAPLQASQRRGSNHSVISYSTESSPTTTSSTFDSPLVPEMPGSPSSSPESASSAVPPQSFQSTSPFGDSRPTGQFSEPTLASPSLRLPVQHPPEEAKRNVKGLTLNMELPTMLRPTSAGAESSLHPFSAPTSPLKTGRRKPHNLTIRTPGFNQLTFATPGLIPPTPSQPMTLTKPLTSPSLSTLASPTLGPTGGMIHNFPSIDQQVEQDASSHMARSLPCLREEEVAPRSHEAPERGYTEGPVKIYDSGIYLYLEPTREEACRFDTVINVAKEVRVPLEVKRNESQTIMSIWRNGSNLRASYVEPQTAMSEKSFKSAFEWPLSSSPSTPTPNTPQVQPDDHQKRPEYLHVPWDHNSEILEDLYPLCQIIDERVQTGKRVLIHCQLGVSRSASLIIAYGLYKGYEPDFHSMYMAVKQRSRWVGPNMSLIYQLTDFKSRCARPDFAAKSKLADPSWFIHSPDLAKTPTAAPVRSSTIEVLPTTNETGISTQAELERPPLRLNKELPPVPPFPTDDKISSLPLPTQQFSIQPPRTLASTTPEPTPSKQQFIQKPLPLRETTQNSSQTELSFRQASTLPRLRFAQPRPFMDLAMQGEPATPSLFSPRATEFVASPFGVTTAGDLVTTAPKRRMPPPGAFPGGNEWRQSLRQSKDLSNEIRQILAHDPRSPHQQGEAKEILRNIEDVL